MATHYGIGTSVIPSSDFSATRDSNGDWTGTHSFTCARTVWENGGRNLFKQDTRITTLNPNLGGYWNFLTVDEVEIASERGEIVTIRATFKGFDTSEEDQSDFIVYSLSGSTTEYPIETHPLFIKEIINVTAGQIVEERPWLLGMLRGEWLEAPRLSTTPAGQVDIYQVSNGHREIFTNETILLWYQAIFKEGHRTWDGPTLQWTKSQTRSTNFTERELVLLGFVDIDVITVAPSPSYGHFDWRKVSMNSVNTGEGFELEETWQMSLPGGWHWLYMWDVFNIDPATTRVF